jgi:hypothetical protein
VCCIYFKPGTYSNKIMLPASTTRRALESFFRRKITGAPASLLLLVIVRRVVKRHYNSTTKMVYGKIKYYTSDSEYSSTLPPFNYF